jgi:hypothetical protein
MILRTVPVRLPEVGEALDRERGGGVRTFVDRETGEIEHVPLAVEVEGVFDDIFASPERWVEVSPLPDQVRVQVRRRFADEVNDPQVRLKLADALGAERPFQRFAAVLREVPGLLDGWLGFRDRELDGLARAWLAAIGLAPGAPGRGAAAH